MLEKYLDRARKKPNDFPHTLIIGGSSSERTNVANAISRQVGSSYRKALSDQVRRPCDMARELILLEHRYLFLVDIENLAWDVQDLLFNAIEESYVPIIIDEWGTSRDKEIELPAFTVVAGTSCREWPETKLGELFMMHLYLF